MSTILPPILNRPVARLQNEAGGHRATAVIFDLDGTLNNCVPNERFDFADVAGASEIMDNIPPNWKLISLCNLIHAVRHVTVIICTARPEVFRGITNAYLQRCRVNCHDVRMRQEGDYRPDAQVKRDMLHSIQETHDVWFVVDDRSSVVKMWREEGVLCLQCADGDY